MLLLVYQYIFVRFLLIELIELLIYQFPFIQIKELKYDQQLEWNLLILIL